MAHTPKRREYLTNWSRQHRAKLKALPLDALKRLRPTVYIIQELHSRRLAKEVERGLRFPRGQATLKE
jgi:hypothetical protein